MHFDHGPLVTLFSKISSITRPMLLQLTASETRWVTRSPCIYDDLSDYDKVSIDGQISIFLAYFSVQMVFESIKIYKDKRYVNLV